MVLRSGVFIRQIILSVCIHSIVKNILSVKISTQNNFMYGKFGIFALFVGRYF